MSVGEAAIDAAIADATKKVDSLTEENNQLRFQLLLAQRTALQASIMASQLQLGQVEAEMQKWQERAKGS